MKPKCPKCKRENTYNAKYDQCSGCGRGYNASDERAERIAEVEKVAARRGTPVLASEIPDLVLVPGEPCPTCGKPVGKTSAQLQKEYRKRKKGK